MKPSAPRPTTQEILIIREQTTRELAHETAVKRLAHDGGAFEERCAILQIVNRAIHQCRMLKQNTSQLEEVREAIRARGK